MTGYRRNRMAGGTYFFTVVTFNRKPFLTSDTARECLREVWVKTQKAHPFELDALCLLPDHIHCIWTLPPDDSDFPVRWAMIKALFTKNYIQRVGIFQATSDSRNSKGESSVWQRRYWEHTIRDEKDYEMHMDYIHYNPVKHGLVNSPVEWQWSSFHRYISQGFYSVDWGINEPSSINGFNSPDGMPE